MEEKPIEALIEKIAKELVKIGFDGYTTLEIAGPENVKKSVERLENWCN